MNSYADALLQINLKFVQDNYLLLQQTLGNTECSAVVKANAYNLGVENIAPALTKAGCKIFFVATIDEGIKLRAILPDKKIYILHGIYNNQEKVFLEFNLIPVLNDLSQIKIWNEFAYNKSQKLEALINLDTGLTRLGLSIKEAFFLLEHAELTANINITYVVSHLSAANEKKHFLNRRQLKKVKKIQYYYNSKISFANSSGIFLGKEFHFDLARAGMALLGLNPIAPNLNPMKPVIRLTTKILQLRHNYTRVPVGYNSTYFASKNSKLATIAIGYADGYSTLLSNKAICYIENYAAPVVGRISMDLTTLDVTNVPEKFLYIGQEVEVIGNNIKIEELANLSHLSQYEIITSLGNRFKKVYIGDC